MSQDEVGSQTPAPRTNAHQPADMLRARTYQPAPHVEVIEVGGVLDLNSAPQFADIVRDQMATPCRTLVLDLSGLTFLREGHDTGGTAVSVSTVGGGAAEPALAVSELAFGSSTGGSFA